MTASQDELWMSRALELARRGKGLCSPNPMVGAVIVKNGIVVGEGWHQKAGQPHAEPNALDAAGDSAKGATLYVSLEPCSSFGRTPPCTERILQAGIRRVVYGVKDPNPKHAGAADAILQTAGIEVTSGILEKECEELNRDFFWWIRRKIPYVTLKMAMTLDGKIATEQGESRWITGSAARTFVQELRKEADAVMVGGTTALQDNPSLLVHSANWPRQPLRLLWTSRTIHQLPPSLQMLQDEGPRPECQKPLSREEWQKFLQELGAKNIKNLLLEGGGELAGAALQAGIVQEVLFFIAPKLLCGRDSRNVTGGSNPVHLAEALSLQRTSVQKIGEDFLFRGFLF